MKENELIEPKPEILKTKICIGLLIVGIVYLISNIHKTFVSRSGDVLLEYYGFLPMWQNLYFMSQSFIIGFVSSLIFKELIDYIHVLSGKK